MQDAFFILQIAGDSIGKILSTPIAPDILRTVKRFFSPCPEILMTTPRYCCMRSLLPSTIRYATVTVSPALKVGCTFPVANASSAILIKSIVLLLINCLSLQRNISSNSSLTAIARKRCKITNYLRGIQNNGGYFSPCAGIFTIAVAAKGCIAQMVLFL